MTRPRTAPAEEVTDAPDAVRTSTSVPPRRGPLTPVELATCGILSGLAVVLGLLATVMPFFNTLLQVLAAVPVAMVAVRLRARASVAAVATTILVSLAIGGLHTAVVVGQSALFGAVVGILYRRGTRRIGVLAVGVVLGTVIGLVTDLLLWALADLRDLMLESIRVSTTGYLRLLGRWDLLAPVTERATQLLEMFLGSWWLWIPLSALVGVTVTVLLAHWIIGVVLSRLQLGSDWDPLRPALAEPLAQPPADRPKDTPADPDPLPTRLRDVHFRYPGSREDALAGIDLDIDEGEFVVVAGPNGSGKSTLALVLSGAEPTSGTVARPGPLGLGHPGGVALLAQRSELQMLGDTVAEDVVWGMPGRERDGVDVEELLDQVGLSGLGTMPTRNLSGGQLQRLALAGVLARHPRLIVSDESTAMIDATGRREMVALLAALPARGTTVVHITHDPSEARGADRLVRLDSGHITFDGPPSADPAGWAPSTGLTSRMVGSGQARSAGQSGPGSASPSSPPVSPASPAATGRDPRPPSSLPATPTDGGDRPRTGRVPIDEGGNATPTDTPAPQWIPKPWERVEHLWADRVSHVYDVGTPWATPVLHDVSLILSQGEGVLVTGDNGSGKTTLSRVLAGLMAPTWGRCTLDGAPMTTKVGEVALSMQYARLQLQRPSVRSDILTAARAPRGMAAADGDRLVEEALAEVSLGTEIAERGIDQLSGGQMRRVALAGLLASEPKVLVLDEPLAGLDPDSRAQVVATLESRRRRGLGVLVISHDVEGLGTLCQREMRLTAGVLS